MIIVVFILFFSLICALHSSMEKERALIEFQLEQIRTSLNNINETLKR